MQTSQDRQHNVRAEKYKLNPTHRYILLFVTTPAHRGLSNTLHHTLKLLHVLSRQSYMNPYIADEVTCAFALFAP